MLGHNIRRLRINQGMTQRDLAEKADLHHVHVCRLENTTTHCTRQSTLVRLANALGCPIDWLVRE